MIQIRALLLVWLSLAVTCAAWPLFNGWAGWPSEAQAYAQWAIYQVSLAQLPLAAQASLAGMGLLLVGAALLFFCVSMGTLVFCAGLLFHAYSKYTAIPTIAASTELGLYAAFYLVSGVVVGVSFTCYRRRAHPPAA